MASFTSSFQIAEQVHWGQNEILRRLGVDELACALVHPALVSRSYRPGGQNAFIERCPPTSETDGGCYVSVVDETLDFNIPDSFVHRSLYELTIHDERFARFWLLPVGIGYTLRAKSHESKMSNKLRMARLCLSSLES